MSTEETEARLLAEWLATPPGTPPPEGLSASAVQAVYALRPDRAPAPRVTIDDVFARVETGPYAATARRGQARSAAGATPVERQAGPRPPARSRRWWAGPAVGLALSAALAAVVVIPVAGHYFSRANQEVASEAGRAESAPAPMATPTPPMASAPEPLAAAAPTTTGAEGEAGPPPPPADAIGRSWLEEKAMDPSQPAEAPVTTTLPEMSSAPAADLELSDEARREYAPAPAPAARPSGSGYGGVGDGGGGVTGGSGAAATAPTTPAVTEAEGDDVAAKPAASPPPAKVDSANKEESTNDGWAWGQKKSTSPSKGKAAEPLAKTPASSRSESAAYEEDAPSAERAKTADKDQEADARSGAVPTDYRNDWYNSRSDVAAVYAQAESQRAAGQADFAVASYLTLLGDADRRVGQDVAWRAARILQSQGRLAEAQRLAKQGLSLSTTNTPQRANLLVLDGDLSLSRGDSASAARSWAEARALNDAR